MHWREVIRRPVITEKSSLMANELNQYTFVVDKRANKLEIKHAVELAWPNVEVVKVRVSNMPAKRARRWRAITVRRTGYKKAVVTLAEGGRIDLFEGVG
jgi:large subunit ribosomal protein L23